MEAITVGSNKHGQNQSMFGTNVWVTYTKLNNTIVKELDCTFYEDQALLFIGRKKWTF